MDTKLKEIEYLADLAELTLSEQEKAEFASDFDKVYQFIDNIKSADTSGVVINKPIANYKDLRLDEPMPSLTTEELLKNAKVAQDNCFVTAKVVG